MNLEHAAPCCIGVTPGDALRQRPRLFRALAAWFDVTFVPCEVEPRLDLAASVSFGGPAAPGVPALYLAEAPGRSHGGVLLADVPALDPRLRGRVLDDRRAAGTAVPVDRGDVVLASAAGTPVWTLRSDGLTRAAAVAPEELAGDASLRDQLVDGDFLGLLPLVELLRAATEKTAWTAPQPRACFVLDDPNLHRPSYGYVSFSGLAAAAVRDGYHVAVATVPADHWHVSRDAAAIFRAAPGLSLALHGNSHLHAELARELPPDRRRRVVAQALRRAESLERRAGVRVSRVMVAPHERCSDGMAETLAQSEVEALCYGWGERGPERPLADWAPADLRRSGLPVLPRRPLAAPRGELALRAYLDQPLILGLHHGDLAGGLEPLAEAAREIDAIAAPRWGSLHEIARADVSTRLDGSTLRLRPYARRFAVRVPPSADRLSIELPATHATPEQERLFLRRGVETVELPLDGGRSGPVPVSAGEQLELVLRRVDSFDHRQLPAPPPQPWAFQRRLLAEGRDRLSPHRRRLGSLR